mgnify:CR=1 FL=1
MKESLEHGKEITFNELKILQMDILSAIDEYCSENGIRYSMACGTLLGAIRHKGYIPWDDDIDIYMPREDYERFNSIFPVVYKDRYKFETIDRDKEWDRPWGKVFDTNTILIEQSKCKNVGVNIDVFPVDTIPADEKTWKQYNRRRLFIQKIYIIKCYRSKSSDGFLKNCEARIIQTILLPFSRHCFSVLINQYAKKYNNSESPFCFEAVQGIFQKRGFNKYIFDDIIEIPFEDRMFKSFKNYDEYLRNGFGNYMQLPPIEKRVTHHEYKAYWI